jgi:nucleoid-associated protein YgaU
MNAASRLGLATLALILIWVVVYWTTERPEPLVDLPSPGAPAITPADTGARITPAQPTSPPRATTPASTEDRSPQDDGASNAPTGGEVVMGEQPTNGVVPPSFRTIIVERGDDAWKISRRAYGTDAYWQAIMLANPGVDPNKLRAGIELRIPIDPKNIQGRPAGDPDDTDSPPPPAQTFVEYTVTSNDTLSGIAKSFYGKASLWRLILNANRDKLRRDDGTDIRPGMVLRLPPPPASE